MDWVRTSISRYDLHGAAGVNLRMERKVAVITRTRERPRLLMRAKDSVCRQVMRDLAWIIVNDGGESDKVEAIAELSRQEGLDARVIHHKTSMGMEASSNAGIASVNSMYIAIHDDDDTWHPSFLLKTTAVLDAQRDAGGVVTLTRTVRERLNGDEIQLIGSAIHNPALTTVQLADMARANMFPPIACLYRRTIYDQLGGYDPSMPVLGDWDFNLRALLIADIVVIREALANYHVRPDAKIPNDHYPNSTVAETSTHYETEARYRNRCIREDIANGKIGLGVLLAIGRMQHLSDMRSAQRRARLVPVALRRMLARLFPAQQ